MYYFQGEWEEEFFTNVKGKSICLICGAAVAMAKRHNVETHFISYHKTFSASSPGSTLRGAFGKQQSYFTKSLKQSKATKHFGWQFAKGIMAVVL